MAPAWNYASSWVDDEIIRPAEHIYQAYVAPVVNTVVHYASTKIHQVSDAYHRAVQRTRNWVHRQATRLRAAVSRVGHAALHVVKTAYHAAAKAATTATRYVKNHAGAIASFALSTVAFLGCEAVLGAATGGVGAVAGAVACGAFAGMVGGLVDQGAKCIGGEKGGCSVGSFVKSGLIGGVVGAAGGALGGVGGKLLGKLAPKALDAVGGLFGRGATDAVDAGAADLTDTAANTQARAAGDSAQSSVDNAGQAAKTGSKPKVNEESGASCPRSVPHSFTGTTPVLLADGSLKPIDQVRVGDKVTNSVPGLSGTQTHTVQNVIVTTTDHDFVDVTIAPTKPASTPPGKSGWPSKTAALAAATLALSAAVPAPASAAVPAGGGTLTTTFHHPFYDQTQAAFVDAKDLHVGDVLQTPTGTTAVVRVRPYHATQTTYDLTIDGLHTYYVIAGTTPVLVHNCGTGQPRGANGQFQSDPNRPITDSTYDRVTLRGSAKQAIRDAHPKDADGNFIDPNTGQSIPAEGPFHYGHRPGFEYWRNRDMAQANGWTRDQFVEFENDPSHYQIEDPYNNLSHQYEQP